MLCIADAGQLLLFSICERRAGQCKIDDTLWNMEQKSNARVVCKLPFCNTIINSRT